ncbi:MAG: phosphotransferase [Asgard group archaeon]|nr:phosphotransferase [Asgard group archaeon]
MPPIGVCIKITKTKKIVEKNKSEVTGTSDLIDLPETDEEEDAFEIVRVEDIESAEVTNPQMKIKGASRVTRVAERPDKDIISREDNKHYTVGSFDPSFMQMTTKEIKYKHLNDELKKFNVISDLVAEVNSGKEASIYIAHLNNSPLIVKLFRLQLTSHNKQKRRKSGNPLTRATSYANREFYLMSVAFRAGLNVPTPAMNINNIILMQFIGENWRPAPQLRNTVLSEPAEMLDEIIEQLKLMYQKARIIHGDFSEYNILVHNDKPIIIDFPQGIDMSLLGNRSEDRIHRNLEVLRKDIQTICDYFDKVYHLEVDFTEVYHYIAGKDASRETVDFTIDEIEEIIKQQQLIVPKAELRDLDVRGK